MSIYEYGNDATGLHFTITATDNGSGGTHFIVQVISGSLDLNAIYWSDNDAFVEGSLLNFTGAKSEANLKLTGDNLVWADDQSSSIGSYIWDGGIKLSDAGLAGSGKATYITQGNDYSFDVAELSLEDFPILGVRATSTNLPTGTSLTGASIKWVDNHSSEPNQPPHAVDDDPACGTERTPVVGNVLGNDTDPDAGDTLTVIKVNGDDLTFVDGWATVGLENGTLKIQADGDFEYTYTGANLPVGGHADPVDTFSYTISDGTGLEGHTDIASVELCIYADAGSPGYWTQQHSLADCENLPPEVLNGTLTFDDFFGLDDGVGPVTNRTWTDDGAPLQDITLNAALSIGTGGPGDSTLPDSAENELALARQAAAAVANYYDADGQDAFLTAYVYQRNLNDNDAVANDFYDVDGNIDATKVLADLKTQVHDSYEGTTGAYSVDALADLLNKSHEG
jgi:Bacterial Ig domain